MSSFSGKIKEFPQISVDRFDGRNLASTAYFLSHAHSDHMVGLSSPQFLDHLESNSGVYLYCSPITERFLQSSIRHRPLTPYICPLQPEESVKITIPNVAEEATHHLWVTLIPAAHCPGSVMFMFEGRGGTVLYTGDFRLSGEETTRCKPLHNRDGTVKLIDSLHIDTTFCHRDIMHFPSREESAQAIADLVEDWLAKGNTYLIHLIFAAKYGYEYIYRNLNERFGMKIHVTRWKYQMYDTVPEIQEVLTLDATETWIHACDYRMRNGGNEDIEHSTNRQLPCRCVPFGLNNKAPNIRVIKPSALFYTMYQSAKEIKQVNEDGTFCRVLLSMHASCSEVLDLVSYLRPRKVFPNVIPMNSNKEEVLKLLHEALNRSGDHYSIEYVGGSQRPTMGSFKRQLQNSESSSQGSSSNLLDAGLLDVYFYSPNKKRRHSDSNMTLVLPTPRGNMKGSLSLEGESRPHEPPNSASSLPCSSTKMNCPKLSVTDSEGESIEWRDPYSPLTNSQPFFESSCESVKEQQSTSLSSNNSSAKYKTPESVSLSSPSTSAVNSTSKSAETSPTSSNIKTKNSVSMKLFNDPSLDKNDEEMPEVQNFPKNLKKTESQESTGMSSVFSDDGDKDSVFEFSDSCTVASMASRPAPSIGGGTTEESATKQSRKMWYKHKYFSTPIHDGEVESTDEKLTPKLSIGLRSSSLPLPEFSRENSTTSSPDLFSSTDAGDPDDRNLPQITVSSPSDQASESQSQISDETNVTVVLSSGEPSDSDGLLTEEALLNENIKEDDISNEDLTIEEETCNNNNYSNNNNGSGNNRSSARPSVIICSSHVDNNKNSKPSMDDKVRTFLRDNVKRHCAPGEWVDCNRRPRSIAGGRHLRKSENPEVVDLVSSHCESSSPIKSELRTSCLKTTRRTQDQVEVVTLDQYPL